jgi:hypothetical protein
MRRLVLPLTLIAAACTDDDPAAVTTAEETGDPGTSSGTPMTQGSDGSTSSGVTAEDSSTADPTLDPITGSSSTDPTDASAEGSTTDEPPAVCGDGMISGNEICELGDFAGNTCQSQGFQSGVLTCSGDCLGFSTSQCFICGDGNIEGTEECDGPLDNDMDCEALGYTVGPISCDMSTCQLDVSGCTFCGDGVAEGTEFCDIDDLFGETCESLGFDSGALACNPDTCGFDYTGCVGGQYIQDFEIGDIPPEFEFSGDEPWEINNTAPLAGSFDARNGDIDDFESSTMTLDVVFSIDGTVDFTHREDTEPCCDFLRFSIDGAELQTWSGNNGPIDSQFPVTAGPHTLQWSYTKDVSLSPGLDSVWIDDLTLFGGVPG